jgi:hypothetical protein
LSPGSVAIWWKGDAGPVCRLQAKFGAMLGFKREGNPVPNAVRVVVVGAVAICFSLIVSEAVAAPGTVLVFAPTNPKPGRVVTVTAVPATPSRCTPKPRCPQGFGGPVIPITQFSGPAKVYLVPNAVAPQIRSDQDSRLIPIGTLRNGRLVFHASKLKNNTAYAAVVSCPVCTFAAHGRTLFVIGVGDNYSGLSQLMLLRPHGFSSGGGVSPWVIGAIAAVLVLVLLLAATGLGRTRRRRAEAKRDSTRAAHQTT